MVISQNTYGRYLILSAAMGVVLSLLWDGFRILHLATGRERNDLPRLVSLFLGDLLYALTAAVSMVLLTYYVNYGRFRWFAFAAAGIGFVSWRVTGGRVLMACAGMLLCALRALIRLFLRPFKAVFRLIRKRAGRCCRRIRTGRILERNLKDVKKRLFPAGKRNPGKRKKRKKERKTV